MSFFWSEFLTVGEKLSSEAALGETDAEAKLRTAIGRAYYALFGVTRWLLSEAVGHKHLLDKVLLQGREVGVHTAVWRLANQQQGHLKELGLEGKRLQIWRERADYEIVFDDERCQLAGIAARIARARAKFESHAVPLLNRSRGQ